MKLHLHARSEYFAQIKAGKKREEYRLHNAYQRNKSALPKTLSQE